MLWYLKNLVNSSTCLKPKKLKQMNTGAVSMRYAKALLSYAKAEGQEEKVYGEMKQLAAHYLSVEGLRRAIATPVLNPSTKHELLCEAAGGKQLSPQTSRFFELVLQARREKLLLFMAYAYIDLYRDDKNILVGKLTTAVASEKLVKHLEQLASEPPKGAWNWKLWSTPNSSEDISSSCRAIGSTPAWQTSSSGCASSSWHATDGLFNLETLVYRDL